MTTLPLVRRLSPNYDTGRVSYRNIFLHSTRGGASSLQTEYEATINWFMNPTSQASAHYVVGPYEATRMVLDQHSAWHASENNPHSLSIEVAQPFADTAYTAFQYEATAILCRFWCLLYDIPKDRVFSQSQGGMIGHEDSQQGQRYGKSDPGPVWNWAHFLERVNGVELGVTQHALDIIWGWTNPLEALMADQAVKEIRDSVVAIKEELGLA